MASGENGSSTRLVLRQGNDNPGIVVVSPDEHMPRHWANSRELHLPPILPQKLDTGLSDRSCVDQTLDDGQGVAAHQSRRLSATELEVGTHRTNRQVSLRKETKDYPKTRENTSILRTKDRLCDDAEGGLELDEEVIHRTELYRRRGRRCSLPVGRSSQPARMQACTRFAEHQQEGCSTSSERDAPKALLDDSETSPRRVVCYKRLGRRYSLPPQGLASRRQTDAQHRQTDMTASDSSRAGLLDSSTDTDDYFSCTGSMRSNLTPLDEDLDETVLQIERYIHRGRRCSLPPANHLNSRFKSSNGTSDLHDHADVLRRASTPIAADCPNLNGLYLKQSGFHTKKLISKSVESLGNVEPLAPSPWRNASKNMPDLNANLSGRKPRGYRAKRDTPTGVTWETKPTHKTFSFTYNDANNVSEMLTPPVTGGIVLKSLHADRPSESQSHEGETIADPMSVDNKETERTQWYSPRNNKYISPTMQVLKDSWRKENNEEKTIRILRWIANEQSQRSNEDGY